MLALKRSSTLTIKTVGPFDLGRLARLHQACFEDPWSRADLAHLLALPGGFGLIARLFERNLSGLDGMRGVGFALCRVVRDEGELLSIGVGPSYRRRSIGSALLRESMERCRRDGYYQRANGTRISAYTMRCDLTRMPTVEGGGPNPWR
jgi:ribosomal-protein-alanine N-acetyltransferase